MENEQQYSSFLDEMQDLTIERCVQTQENQVSSFYLKFTDGLGPDMIIQIKCILTDQMISTPKEFIMVDHDVDQEEIQLIYDNAVSCVRGIVEDDQGVN